MEAEIRRVAVVIRGLLEVGPIGPHVFLQLLDEDCPPSALPPPGTAELGKQRAQIQQAERLAREVGVGAVVGRWVRLDVSTLQVEKLEHLEEHRRRETWRGPEEVQPPNPRDHSKGHLKAAGPIHSALRGIRAHPVHQVLDERRCVALVARIPIGLPEGYEILLPIELPDQLVVSCDLRVQVIDAAPMPVARPRSRCWVPVPIDRVAEIQVGMPQEVELPVASPLRLRDDTSFKVRPAAA